jgi:hypothetical protein
MKRRTVLVLTGTTLLALAIAGIPQASFAQSDPLLGTWQLNLTKSKYSPGPPPRSNTTNIQAEGQGIKVTITGTAANGNPINIAITRVFDGIAHPVTGNPNFDAVATMRVDAYAFITSRTKAGKLVQTDTDVVSQDGKMWTFTSMGTDANGRLVNNIAVYDKQ